jgi:DNA-binding response OmpR family regulator
VGFSPLEIERIRASLSRSPFYFLDSETPLPDEEVDAYVAHARDAAALLRGGGRAGAPVLACGASAHMRAAFLAGAADYLREPWEPEELGLRLMAAMEKRAASCVFPWGTLTLKGNLLSTEKTEIPLTFHESRLLRVLLMNRGTPVPRSALAYRLWGSPGPKGSRALDVHVASIRKKVAAAFPAAGRFVKPVRNEGYVIE